MAFDAIPSAAVPDVEVIRPPDVGRAAPGAESKPAGEEGFSFWDFLDIINPLQHIPIISTIYRAITRDEISPSSRVVGGALFGGPIGFAVALVNVAVEGASGKDVGANVVALVSDPEPDAPLAWQVAEARPFGQGAASGSDLPAPALPGGGGLFAWPLALPHFGDDDSRGGLSPSSAAATAEGALPLRAEDLSSRELARILAGYQRAAPVSAAPAATPAPPPPAAAKAAPTPPPRPGLLPTPPMF